MQTHYFELRAIPQIELTEVMVINQLMQGLHQVLINHQGKIGICFPNYTQNQRKTLGGIIRLFGQESELITVKNELSKLTIINDYAVIFDVKTVPKVVHGYLSVSRVRTKGQSALRRAEKRLSQQGKWSSEVQNKMITKWGNINLNYPHCHLTSSSTGQRFILWIKQQQRAIPKEGVFNCYGMSQSATVPSF